MNSATNIGGKTRVYYKINLPVNTVEWYYIFTTSPNIKGSNLNLFKQISTILVANPVASILANSLSVDSGEHPIDVFLMDNKGFSDFNEKGMFGNYANSRPSHYPDGSVLNSKEGKIKINNINKGSFYLGIRNPSINIGVNVKIEVVAIVEEVVTDNNKWSKETKELLYNQLIADLKKNNFSDEKIQSYANCLMTKITKEYSPKDFSEMANYEVTEIFNRFNSECNKL